MTKHTIEVIGIKTYSFHGCLPEETKIGGKYEVDVKMVTDFSAAAANDDLTKTIDYVTVNKIVEEEMAIPAKLIETVGKRIVNRVKQEVAVLLEIKVVIKKICPPINGDVHYVSIEIEERF